MEGENNEFSEKKDEAKKEIKETIKNDVLSEIRKQPEIAREILEKPRKPSKPFNWWLISHIDWLIY